MPITIVTTCIIVLSTGGGIESSIELFQGLAQAAYITGCSTGIVEGEIEVGDEPLY